MSFPATGFPRPRDGSNLKTLDSLGVSLG